MTHYAIEVYRPRVDGYIEWGYITAPTPQEAISEYRTRAHDQTQKVRAVAWVDGAWQLTYSEVTK